MISENISPQQNIKLIIQPKTEETFQIFTPAGHFADEIVTLHGDCLKHMRNIPDDSIDLILCDLPYGVTKCKWGLFLYKSRRRFRKNRSS